MAYPNIYRKIFKLTSIIPIFWISLPPPLPSPPPPFLKIAGGYQTMNDTITAFKLDMQSVQRKTFRNLAASNP